MSMFFYWLFVSCELGSSRSVESCPAECIVSLTPLKSTPKSTLKSSPKSTPKSSSHKQHIRCRQSRELSRHSSSVVNSMSARVTHHMSVTSASRRLRYLRHCNHILSPTRDTSNSHVGQLFILHKSNSVDVYWKLVVISTILIVIV